MTGAAAGLDLTVGSGCVRFVPILHGRLEFAHEVRAQLFAFRPDVVAVEFPVTLRPAIEAGVERLPLLSVLQYRETDGTDVYTLFEPTDGLLEAVRTAQELGIPRAYVDRDTEGYTQQWESFPDPYSLGRVGHGAYCAAFARVYRLDRASRTEEDRLREQTMAANLQELVRRHGRVLFACGLAHYPAVAAALGRPEAIPIGRTRREGVVLSHLAEESSRELLSDLPWDAAAYERFRAEMPRRPVPETPLPAAIDRLSLHAELFEAAAAAHAKNSGEEISLHQRRVFFQFARNQALVSGGLAPQLYELLVSARGAADDNFAYEMWELGTRYPWQDDQPRLPVLRLSWEDLLKRSRRFRFRRRLPRSRRRLVPVPIRKRPRERRPGEWKELWNGGHIVSYPPEDIVVEGYGHYLKRKALEILSEEQQRTLAFTTSLLDGIDVRETMRNWHEGKLFVKENRPVRGKVGSVVVIFDEDLPGGGRDEGERYPWLLTWLGEHHQESDMALYATPPDRQIVGPGVARCEYGGFMLTHPPMRVWDVWNDDTFAAARTKSERLLLAAIDYCEERSVVYVAARPPRSRMHSLAERVGRKLIYLPIGQLSPVSIQRIRVFHVLDGAPVRRWAKQFIW